MGRYGRSEKKAKSAESVFLFFLDYADLDKPLLYDVKLDFLWTVYQLFRDLVQTVPGNQVCLVRDLADR